MYRYTTDTSKGKEIGISFKLRKKVSDALARAAKASGRTKRIEAKLRLEDHIRRFEHFNQFVDKDSSVID